MVNLVQAFYLSDFGQLRTRIYRIMAAVTLVGAAAASFAEGGPGLLGFLTGAFFSAVNFWFWHRLVGKVGAVTADGESPRTGSVVLFALRYGAFALGLYAILQFSEASLSAALAGCFVAVAAVLLEIFFELIYGT